MTSYRVQGLDSEFFWCYWALMAIRRPSITLPMVTTATTARTKAMPKLYINRIDTPPELPSNARCSRPLTCGVNGLKRLVPEGEFPLGKGNYPLELCEAIFHVI